MTDKKTENKERENETKVSAKVTKLVDQVADLSVMELSELVNALQDKLGVSAMPVATAPAQVADATEGDDKPAGAVNQTVVLTAIDNKIAAIKAIREIDQNVTLGDAKTMTESLPAEILKDAKAEDAKEAAEKLKAAGCGVELK